MKQHEAAETGLALYAAASLLLVGGGALFVAYRSGPTRGDVSAVRLVAPAEPSPPAVPVLAAPVQAEDRGENDAARPDPGEMATALVAQLDALLEREPNIEPERLALLRAEIIALGETAAPALVQRIDALGKTAAEARRARLFDILRHLPGKTSEDRLIREARSGSGGSVRTLAIEALGDRHGARAVDALARIAETDSDLPERPLITSPRDPSDISVELPDETVFTPRMQAMAALAATREQRAGEVLTGVLHDGPNEALRMEAASRLAVFRESPSAVEALRSAATGDPSTYVRLAALHALAGSTNRSLAPVLESIAARDTDAGVRALARRVLDGLLP